MNNYSQNDVSTLNGLLAKHKQMQERSAIKSQPLALQTAPNVTSTVNPMLQPTNGLCHFGSPALAAYPNNYYMGTPMMQCPTSYYNANPILQPANSYFNTNPMLQHQNNYFNPNFMLQPAPSNYFNPNPMMHSQTNFFNPNPAPQFTVPQSYFNQSSLSQSLIPQYNNYFDHNLMTHFQNNAYLQNPVTDAANNSYAQNLVLQYINGGYDPNPVPQCVENNYSQNPVTPSANDSYAQNLVLQYINGGFNPNSVSQCVDKSYSQKPVTQSVNNNFNVSQNVSNSLNQNFVNSYNSKDYHDPNHHVPSKPVSNTSKNRVYVNPRYKNPLAAVDLKRGSSNQKQEQVPSNTVQDSQANVPGKCKVLINPKYMTKLMSDNKEENIPSGSSISNTATTSVTTVSTEKISSCQTTSDVSSKDYAIDKNTLESSNLQNLQQNDNISDLETNRENSDASKENENSSIVILSRRKLVRVKKNFKTDTSCINFMKPVVASRRRMLSTGSKKLKISPKKSSLNQQYDTNKLKYVNSTVKKVLGRSLGLISIDGVLYNKSRNQLIRSNSSVVKRKRVDSSSDASIDYYVAEDGKKLLKLDIVKKKSDVSLAKLNTSLSPVKNFKANASYKVKQRSLQILRDKMRKNNQPCLLFKKFGYCANQLKGTCPKVHDKKLVAVCRKFLQGKCLLKNCPLSHDVGPEKMPTCKYFLNGFCTREGCPYLHVKVSSNKPICQEFIRGYCPRGNECPNRHIIACPEFDKSGSCSKGKFCPYPHKSPLLETKRPKGTPRRKSEATASASTRVSKLKSQKSEAELVESKKRYYDESSEDLSQKWKRPLKQVDIAKSVHVTMTQPSEPPSNEQLTKVNVEPIAESSEDTQNSNDEKLELVSSKPKKPPIGPLPAYIPIE